MMPTTLQTIPEMKAYLKKMGLKRDYKPYWDGEPERGHIMLETHRPIKITDGIMSGVEFDVYDDHTIRMWTCQKNKAAECARTHGLTVRLLDGEAEMFFPADKADEHLHDFGAKVKRQVVPSPKSLEALRQTHIKRQEGA